MRRLGYVNQSLHTHLAFTVRGERAMIDFLTSIINAGAAPTKLALSMQAARARATEDDIRRACAFHSDNLRDKVLPQLDANEKGDLRYYLEQLQGWCDHRSRGEDFEETFRKLSDADIQRLQVRR